MSTYNTSQQKSARKYIIASKSIKDINYTVVCISDFITKTLNSRFRKLRKLSLFVFMFYLHIYL